ncbi:glycosyltransferase family 2 protein [Paraglaciecola chathamensis]|uniref:glycosyltransferase family 2 protein n=1 Tax=Paraglaciecola chathamensis TaxID=368405 RepID=UPI0026FEAD68|nr:glycosyltransferase family 2 protein [Paraglaciecola chathamensis]MDO6558195.1 glycosyltransferase family 2 protein [Paraglaciecola chathamensis]
MASDPIIQVLMPVFNADRYLELAIESIRGQSFLEWELLIIDDGSTDESLEIIKAVATKDSRITWRARENRGLVSTLNELVEWSTSPFLARMDADDICSERRLERQLYYLEEADLDIVGCWAEVFGTKNEVWHFRQFHEDIHITSVFGKSCMLIASLLCRRKVFEDYSFNPEYVHLEEYDFISRIVADNKYKLGGLREVLYLYRQHNDSVIYQHKEYRDKRYKQRLFEHLQALGVHLKPKEFEYYLKFIRSENVPVAELDDLAKVVEKAFINISPNRPDDNCEFQYRWLLYCKTHMAEKNIEYYVNKYIKNDDIVFLEYKEYS